VQAVTFYVLINSTFVGKEIFELIKMHGRTKIKITLFKCLYLGTRVSCLNIKLLFHD
jgi:hypothetical protein